MKREVILRAPHIVTRDSPYLNASNEIANYRFKLNPDAIGPRGIPTGNLGKPDGVPHALSAFGLLTLAPGLSNIRIVDCEFEGPWRHLTDIPDSGPGHAMNIKGIQMQYNTGIRIEGCDFRYIPKESIYFHGCQRIDLEWLWSRSCSHLVRAHWPGPRNRFIRMNHLHASDGWQTSSDWRKDLFASQYEPLRNIGGNVVVGYLADSEIRNLTTSGEVKSALKLVCPIRVRVSDMHSSQLNMQGTMYFNHTKDPTNGNGRIGAYNHVDFDESLGWHADDNEFADCVFRPLQNAWMDAPKRPTFQLSYHHTNLRFRNCVVYAPAPGHYPVAVNDGVDADIRDSLFIVPHPDEMASIQSVGRYKSPGSRESSLNANFAEANRFRRAA